MWVIGGGLLVMTALLYWRATYVSGVELNTLTWERRGFAFRRDPLTGYQLTAVQHNPRQWTGWWSSTPNPHAWRVPAEIGRYLLKAPPELPQRWDLVRLDRSRAPGAAANILVLLLEGYDRSYQLFWPQWSVDHPARAAVVWPAAQQLVAFGQYHHLPGLLELAVLDTPLEQLTSDVGQLVQQALLEYCQRPEATADARDRQAAARVGLSYGPHPQLQTVMDQSR